MERTRQVNGNEGASVERRYYISSLDRRTKAKRLAEYIRGHWSVENNWLHGYSVHSSHDDPLCSGAGLMCLIRA